MLICRADTTITAELRAPRLGRLQRSPSSSADHASLELGDSNHLLEYQTTRRTFELWQIGKPDINASLQQAAQERHRSRQPINLADDQRTAMQPRRGQRLVQFRAIRASARFDLGELRDDLPVAAAEIGGDSGALGIQPKTADLSKPESMQRWMPLIPPVTELRQEQLSGLSR
jgi:hypothetical protein